MALIWWCSGVVLGLALVWPGQARACGGGGVAGPAVAGVVANSQRVVISVRDNGTTDMVVQVGVPDTSADYGVLIPTPSEPSVDPAPIAEEVLDELDKSSRPTIYDIEPDTDTSSGCSCVPIAGSSGGKDNGGSSVTASQPTNVGPVTATVVTATDATALNQWLAASGFVIPDEQQDLVASYVGPGRYFIAVKRSDAAVTHGPTSIGLHYTLQGDHRLLSLAFARLGAAPTVGFTVFLCARTPTKPTAPFQSLTINDLDPALLFKNDYQGAIQAAVRQRGGAAFVIEAYDVGPTGDRFYGTIPLDDGVEFVRMTTIVTPDELTQDVTFLAGLDMVVPTTRYVQLTQPAPKAASFGILGLVALGWQTRRRRRRA